MADEGTIEVFGKPLQMGSPRAAINAGIGMVHQHFTLAENLSVIENITLGTEPLWQFWQNQPAARQRLTSLSQTFGLVVDPDARVGALSVGERQRVEILKALYRDTKILILDEPTAVLTPQERDTLFATLGKLTQAGLAVVFISHKLHEVMAVSDRIIVLRSGLIVVAGFIAGGILLLLPALLKTLVDVDEVVTTLLLNFIVLLFISYLIEGPLKDPAALGWPQATPLITEAELPRLFGRAHLGSVIAILSAIVVWVLNSRAVWGYEMKAVGANQRVARFVGIPIKKVILYTALLSGGLAGVAGVSEVAGIKGYLTLDLSPGFGYTGIVVAMLAQLHLLGVIISAVFIAAIYVGLSQGFNGAFS